jgi:hypothetical protein
MDIWNSSWKFGIFIPVLVFCTKKTLATLLYPLVSQELSWQRQILSGFEPIKLSWRAFAIVRLKHGRGRSGKCSINPLAQKHFQFFSSAKQVARFFWYNITKCEQIYQITTKYNKWLYNTK